MTRVRLLVLVAWLGLLPMPGHAQSKLELIVQTGHVKYVTSVAFSSDGRLVLTASNDKTAILWNAQTGQMLRTFRGHRDSVSSAAFGGDGKRVVSGSGDKTIKIWEAATGRELLTLQGHTDHVNSVGFSPDGRRIVSGAGVLDAGEVKVWDAASGKELLTLKGHTGPVWTVAFSPDGKHILSGCRGRSTGDGVTYLAGEVKVWNATTGQELLTLKGFEGDVIRAAFSVEGKHIAAAIGDYFSEQAGEVRIWDVATGKLVRTLQGHARPVVAVAWSPDGGKLASSSSDGAVILWDTRTGNSIRRFQAEGGGVYALAFNPDGSHLLTGGVSPTATLWDARTAQQVRTFRGHIHPLHTATFSPDGQRIVTGSKDTTAVVWDAQVGRLALQLRGHSDAVWSAVFSPDGRQIFTGSLDKTAILWDAKTGGKLLTLERHTGEVSCVAFAPDGSQLLTVSLDQGATLWDRQTGRKLRVFREPKNGSDQAVFSPDGRQLLTGHRSRSAILWDGATGEVLRRLPVDPFFGADAVAFSADGRHVLTGFGSGMAILWDRHTGQKLRTVGKKRDWGVCSVAFDPDGKQFLVGSALEGLATLWDTKTGTQLRRFAGHNHWLNAVAFSPNGRQVLTASEDGTAQLWDKSTGEPLLTLISVNQGKDWLVVTPQGLFDGSPNGTKLVSYRLTGTLEFVPLDRYRHKYWQPGLLGLLMKGERPTPSVNINKSLPPRVHFAPAFKSGMEIPDSKLEVEAFAEPRGDHPVKVLRLLLNGRPYRGELGIHKVADPKPGKVSVKWTIELAPGRHTLQVLADTDYVRGTPSDELEVVYIGGGLDPDKLPLPSLYVLAIGISKYPGSRALDYPAKEAQSLAKILQTHSKDLYKGGIETKVLTDKEANREGIFEGLLWLREKMTRSKSVGIIFFGGHGERDKDGGLYFLPADFKEKNLAASAIDADILRKQLAGIPGRLMLILDTCHAGAIGEEGAGRKLRGPGALTDQWVRDLTADENGMIVLCSAMGNESARDGVYMKALLEGLSGRASRAGDRAIYLVALDAYVRARVRELSRGQQNPVASRPTCVRDFPVSRP